jgi:hypothetical protein
LPVGRILVGGRGVALGAGDDSVGRAVLGLAKSCEVRLRCWRACGLGRRAGAAPPAGVGQSSWCRRRGRGPGRR